MFVIGSISLFIASCTAPVAPAALPVRSSMMLNNELVAIRSSCSVLMPPLIGKDFTATLTQTVYLYFCIEWAV